MRWDESAYGGDAQIAEAAAALHARSRSTPDAVGHDVEIACDDIVVSIPSDIRPGPASTRPGPPPPTESVAAHALRDSLTFAIHSL
jgi:hypothetical protein